MKKVFIFALFAFAPALAFAGPVTASPVTAQETPQATPQTTPDCSTTGCPSDKPLCKGNPPTCQANTAVCTPACSGSTPICNQFSDGTYGCISQAQYGGQGVPGTPTTQPNAQTFDNTSPTGFVPLAPIPGLTQGVVANSSGLPAFLNNLYKYAIGLAAAIVVVMIVWGGLEMSVQESVTQKLEGKQRIYNALFGLVLVLAPALVFGIINPSILNLSLNLPALDTTSGVQNTPTSGSPTRTTTAGGVTKTVVGTYLQTAHFSSNNDSSNNNAADAWIGACNSGGSLGYLQTSSSCSTSAVSSGSSGSACTGASDAVAQCSKFSSSAFVFVNAGTWYGSYKFEPLPSSSSGVSAFRSSCTSDGGNACVSNRASNGSNALTTFKSLDSCPESVSGLPGNASGKCYSGNLFCSRNAGASQCVSGASFYPN